MSFSRGRSDQTKECGALMLKSLDDAARLVVPLLRNRDLICSTGSYPLKIFGGWQRGAEQMTCQFRN